MDISEADILAVFEEETNVDSAKLQPSATLASLDIASLDLIGVSFALEDKFGWRRTPSPPAPTSARWWR